MGNLSSKVQEVHNILKALQVHMTAPEHGFPEAAEGYGFDRALFEEIVDRELTTLYATRQPAEGFSHALLMGYIAGKTGLLDKQPTDAADEEETE